MAQQIKLKRSAVAGRVPTTSSLALGEVAINTADGKLFFQRGDDTIQSFFTTNALITGSLQQSGSDSYFLSNVGIGKDNPFYTLDVKGGARFQTTAGGGGDGVIQLGVTGNNGYPRLTLGKASTPTEFQIFNAGDWRVGSYTNSDVSLYTNNTERVRIKNDGKVGIGISTPSQQLHVSGNIQQTGPTDSIYLINGSEVRGSNALTLRALNSFAAISAAGSIFYTAGTDHIFRDTNSNALVTVKQSGNVGIGTTTPSQKLEVRDGNLIVSASQPQLILDPSNSFGHNFTILATGANTVFSGSATTYFRNKFGTDVVEMTMSNLVPRIYFDGQVFNTGFISASGDLITESDLLVGYNTNLGKKVTIADTGTGQEGIHIRTGQPTIELQDWNTGGKGVITSNEGSITLQADVNANKASSNISFEVDTVQRLRVDENGVQITGSLTHDGDLTVTGTVTAQEFKTEFVSASIIYRSGSTKFGDTLDDQHSFTGSVEITGSLFSNKTYLGTTTTHANDATNDVTINGILSLDDTYLRVKGINVVNLASNAWTFNSSITPVAVGYKGYSTQDFTLRTGNAGYNLDLGLASQTNIRIQSGSGNVSIGTTTDSGQVLTVGGNAFFTPDNSHVYFGNQNTFVGERSNSNQLELRGGGSTGNETLYLDSSGRLGFGTSSPTEKITVKDGNILIDNAGTVSQDANLTLKSHANGESRIIFRDQDGTSGSLEYINQGASDRFRFGVSGSAEALTITKDGNVGIGTSTPQYPLHVMGGSNHLLAVRDVATAVRIGVGKTNPSYAIELGSYSDNAIGGIKYLRFYNGTDRLDVTGNGRFNFQASRGYFFYPTGSTPSYDNYGVEFRHLRDSATNTNDNILLVEKSDGTDVFNVKSSGNIGIGTSTPSEILTVEGNISSSGNLYIDGSITGSALQIADINYPTTDGTLNQAIVTDGAGNLSFGDVQAATALNTTVTVKNISGGTIEKGTPLYITGSGTGGNIVGVYPADASRLDRMPALAIAGEQLLDEAEGVGLLDGYIGGVNTSAFASGDEVFVAVGGGYTNVAPTGSGVYIQKLGNVEKVHASNGSGVINGPNTFRALPNWETGKVMVGTDIYPVTSSVIHLDEANGRLGVGTTSPSVTFHVGGFARLNGGLQLEGANRYVYAINNTSLLLGTNNTERMRIDASGNVGIGTASPSYKLDVSGSGNFTDGLTVTGSILHDGDLTVTGTVTAQEFKTEFVSASIIYRSGSTKFGDTVDDVHNFTGSLKIKSAGSGANAITFQESDSLIRWSNGSFVGRDGFYSGIYDLQLRTFDGTSLQRRLHINADDGNVGIGTTSPTERLHITGSQRIDGDEMYLSLTGSSRKPVRLHHNGYKGAITIQRDGINNVNISSDQPFQGHTYFNGNGTNVGIGNTAPQYKLDVTGQGRFTDGLILTGSLVLTGSLSAFGAAFTDPVTIYDLDDTENPRLSVGRRADQSLNFDVGDRVATIYHKQDETNGNQELNFEIWNDSPTREFNFKFADQSGGIESTPLTISSSGYVGIGTTAPTVPLHVQGDILVNNEVRFINSEMRIIRATDDMRFRTANVDNMVITSAGRVGIGTISPSASLHVGDDSGGGRALRIEGNVGSGAIFSSRIDFSNKGESGNEVDFRIGLKKTNDFVFVGNAAADEIMRIEGDTGKIGIGTAGPLTKLSLADDSSGAILSFKRNNSTTTGAKGGLTWVDSSNYYVAGISVLGDGSTDNSGELVFRTSTGEADNADLGYQLPERMRIDSSGNVSIGNTSAGTARLLVDHTNTKMLELKRSGVTKARFIADNNDGQLDLYNASTSNTIRLLSSGSSYFTGGNVGIGTTTPAYKLDVSGSGNFTDGLTVTGSILHDGDLTVTGTVTAQEFKTEFVSASIIYRSGSTKFGDTADDVHQFTGSVFASEGVFVPNGKIVGIDSTSGIEFGDGPIGNELRDISIFTDTNGEIALNRGGRNVVFIDSNLSLNPAGYTRVANGNFGIGAVPTSKLHVNGDADISGSLFLSRTATYNSQWRIFTSHNSTANYGSLYFTPSLTTSNYYFRNSANADLFFISGSGNVGIGTTTPAYKLDVATNLGVTFGASSYVRINKESLGDIGITAPKIYSGTETLGFQSNNGTTSFNFAYGATSLMTMKSNGNVGIGTTSPSATLHVSGSTGRVNIESEAAGSSTPQLYIEGNKDDGAPSLATLVELKSNNDFRGRGIKYTHNASSAEWFSGVPYQGGGFQIGYDGSIGRSEYNASASLFIDTSGNVGINNSVPSAFDAFAEQLVVGNGATHQGITIYTGTTHEGSLYFADGTGTGITNRQGQVKYSHADNSMRFSTAATERVRIDSSGNVGIGTTSPSEKLTVEGNISASGDLYLNGIIQTDEIRSSTYPNYNILNLEDDNVNNTNGVSLLSVSSMVFGLDVNDNSTNDQFEWRTDGAAANSGSLLMTLTDEGDLDVSGSGTFNNKLIVDGVESANPTPDTDQVRLSGYGMIGNRGVLYITNAWSGGSVQIGNGSSHSADQTAHFRSNAVLFERNVGINRGQSTPPEALTVSGSISASGDLYLDSGNILIGNTSAAARIDVREDSGYAFRAEDAAGHYFRVQTGGNVEMRGDLTVGGIVTAQEFHTEFVSASIMYDSGSTKFGDDTGDNHSFTGSILLSGSYLQKGAEDNGGKADFAVYTGNYAAVSLRNNQVQIGGIDMNYTGRFDYDADNLTVRAWERDIRLMTQASTTTQAIQFHTANSGTTSEKMRITGAGNVGIGTTSPTAQLHISSSGTPLKMERAGYDTYGFVQSTGTGLQVQNFTDNRTDMFFKGDGTVGIGTTTPSYKLHVSSSNNNDGIAIHYPANNSTVFPFYVGSANSGIYARLNATNFEFKRNGAASTIKTVGSNNNLALESANDVVFNTSGANERMRINSSGNVGIGTNSPSTRLEVSSSGANGIDLSVDGSNSSLSGRLFFTNATSGQGVAMFNIGGDLSIRTGAIPNNTTGTERLRLYDDGSILISGYGSGTNTGTAAYTLAVDSSGNIIEVDTSNINAGENTDVDTGTEVVDTFSSGSGASAFTNYVVNDGTNYRAGQLMTVWNTAGSIEYTDVSTNSIGDTSEVFIFAAVNGADIEIKATVPSDNWVVRVNSTLL